MSSAYHELLPTETETRGPALIIVGAILIGIMVLFVSARVYTKIRIIKHVGWDDVTCLLAMIGSIGFYAACVMSVKIVGRHQWDVPLGQIRDGSFLMLIYIINILPWPVYVPAKLTFFLLYLRIFRVNRAMRYAIYFGAILCSAFYFVIEIIGIVFTTPNQGQDFLDAFLSPQSPRTRVTSIVAAVFGVISDFYILCLPLPIVWKLRLTLKERIGIIAVFLTGLLACFSSILSLYYRIILNETQDLSWDLAPVFLLIITELCVGVVCSCMPAVSALIRHCLPRIRKFVAHNFNIGSYPCQPPRRRSQLSLATSSVLFSNNRSFMYNDSSKHLSSPHSPIMAGNLTLQDVEKANMRVIKTTIRSGRNDWKRDADEIEALAGNGIMMKQEIKQGWVNVPRLHRSLSLPGSLGRKDGFF